MGVPPPYSKTQIKVAVAGSPSQPLLTQPSLPGLLWQERWWDLFSAMAPEGLWLELLPSHLQLCTPALSPLPAAVLRLPSAEPFQQISQEKKNRLAFYCQVSFVPS